jgi:hypothetical protein
MRLLVVAVIAVFGLATVAYAQSAAVNEYTVDGSVSAHGGSKQKPKPGGLKFSFTTSAGDLVPNVIKTYKITFSGGKVNTQVAKACTAKQMDQAQSDSNCPKGSLIGTGQINNYVSTSGSPAAGATQCKLPLKIYNAGKNKAALWIKTGPPDCIAAVAQAIDAKWSVNSKGASLSFTVPDGLRHQLGLDLPVISTTSTIKKITKKIKGKTVGYLESVGCGKSKKRTITATFTDEGGRSETATKEITC